MKLPDKVYSVIKWALMIGVPALLVLITTLGKIYGWNTETVTLTISAITVFLGAITGVSNYNYKNQEDK